MSQVLRAGILVGAFQQRFARAEETERGREAGARVLRTLEIGVDHGNVYTPDSSNWGRQLGQRR